MLTFAAAAADLDRDGRPELYIGTPTGGVVSFLGCQATVLATRAEAATALGFQPLSQSRPAGRHRRNRSAHPPHALRPGRPPGAGTEATWPASTSSTCAAWPPACTWCAPPPPTAPATSQRLAVAR
ncbi:MAG: hypothetical protein WKG07_25405 [Hymenobacter sp.]